MNMMALPNILIVDDHPENLFALQKLLKPLDVEVFQANSGDEALGLLLEYEFFVAIVDVQMPGMDGYKLVELLRANESTAILPVIFVSAVFSDEYHYRKGYEAGAVDFISKPFIPEILLGKVKVFLDLFQQRRALKITVEQLNRTVERLNSTVDQLALVNHELETFSYSISHDLRAPLRAIDGFSRMLSDALGDEVNEDARHYLDSLHNNIGEMNELIAGLLHFSRLAFEPLTSRTIDMKELAQYVLNNILSAQPERKAKISLADLPTAWGDPLLIKQVFSNLIDNAFKYTRNCEIAQIEIGFFLRDGQNVFFVRDNGVGFDMQYAEKLFDVFQRLHSAAEFEGLGIGLANVRRIILRHGGQIWAEASVGQGATFYFSLPAPAKAD
jgi:two-component system, sensor histidine kinase and response regulator